MIPAPLRHVVFLMALPLLWGPSGSVAQRALLPSQQSSQEAVSAPDAVLPAAAQKKIRDMVLTHPSLTGLDVVVSIGKPSRSIGECGADPEFVFASPQGRPWGPFQVMVRCSRPVWTVAVPVQTRVEGPSVLASRYLAPGVRIRPEDIQVVKGDITRSPPDLVRQAAEVVGKAPVRPVQHGSVLLLNNLREPAVIKIGEVIQVQVAGRGFQATGEGVAITAGGIGDMIRIRMPDGQQVTGQVVRPGVVEIVIQ